MGNHADSRFTDADAEVIKRKAKRLAGHYRYRSTDVEDIEQELATHVFQQTARHDPARGSREKFVSKVVKNKLLHLIEQRTAKKRDDQRNVHLDAVGEGALLDGSISADVVDITFDVRAVLARLPVDLRRIAVLLGQGHGEKDICVILSLTRGQVRWRMQQLARAFIEAGLGPNRERRQPNGARFR